MKTIFDVLAETLADYRDFVGSFLQIADERIRAYVEENVLKVEEALWPEPLLQLTPSYAYGPTVKELAEAGILHPKTADIFQRDGKPIQLFRHQEEAIRKAGLAKISSSQAAPAPAKASATLSPSWIILCASSKRLAVLSPSSFTL